MDSLCRVFLQYSKITKNYSGAIGVVEFADREIGFLLKGGLYYIFHKFTI
jgi:hypothetical protein